jgi:hypothetical protein
MKRINILLTAFVFMVTACDNDDTSNEQTYYEQTYYGTGALSIVNEQVWVRNYSTNRLSQAYERYDEKKYDVVVLREFVDETDEDNVTGFGTINGGILNFTANVPDNLLQWEKLKVFFNTIVEGEGWDVDIDDDTVKGTFILLLTVEEPYALMREGLSGTSSSLSDETVFFLYVDGDCIISAGPQEDERVMYTFNPFTLGLKAGWNTVWYKQTYTSSGISSFSMDKKNPDLKWVLVPTVQTK